MNNLTKPQNNMLSMDAKGCILVPSLVAADVIEYRNALQLTQKEFAEKFDIPLTTLRNWETGRAKPIISQARLQFYNNIFKKTVSVDHELEAELLEAA